MTTNKIHTLDDLILHHCKMTPNNKKFVSFEGDERSFEEQVVYLSQTLRALEQALRDQQEILDSIQNRLYYIEATGLNNTN